MSDTLNRLRDHASQLLQADRVPEAIAAHQQWLAADPAQADGWYNLGYLLHRAGQFLEALQAYEQALAHGVQGAEEIHLNRAVILAEHLQRSEDALVVLQQALDLQPRFLPALLNLGNLHERRGDCELAQAQYEAALAVDPQHALALARLAGLGRFQNPDDPLIQRVRQAMVRPNLHPAERADLGYGLGKALDDAGDFDAAFEAYAQANQACRVAYGRQPVHYDRAAQERYVDAMMRLFDRPTPPTDDPDDGSQPPAVFICGMFRSGSTLLEQILASHPGVTAGGEIPYLPMMARQHLPAALQNAPSRQGLDPALLAQLRRQYRQGVALQFPQAGLLTDKRPDNFLYLGLAKALFPRARILHTRRAALDNCLSLFFLHLGPGMPYALDLEDIAHWYRQYRRLMAHWQALYGEDIHDVAYDELVRQPRPVVEGALGHVGLAWDDACLGFHTRRSVIATPSAWQVRQPLYTRASGRWRHYPGPAAVLREALGDFADD